VKPYYEDDEDQEPVYDLGTLTWSKSCPCVDAMQVDPECPYHGRLRDAEGDAS
jgi:hypothetical protein